MELEPIDETEETTSASSEAQLTQQELEKESKRHDNTLACCKTRVKEEEERHNKQHRLPEAKLLQATAQAEDSVADDDCWLNNGSIPKTTKQCVASDQRR